ncbi:MAG: NTP transferase domain-containing protein [Candidatus Zixiibacteriota bacterium]
MSKPKAAIILAAGKGKRMNSDLPKVLHEINGRPILGILLDTLVPIGFERICVVIGHEGEMVQKRLKGYPITFAWQREQHGTGHAVMMTREQMADFDGTTLVLLGDVPLLSRRSIELLLSVHEKTSAVATCLTTFLEDPTGYGRIVRGSGASLQEIVEHKDASDEIRKIREINSGTFCFDNQSLFGVLDKLENNNVQSEYYLTDTVKIFHDNGLRVSVAVTDDPDEVRGINSVEQLDQLATIFADRA